MRGCAGVRGLLASAAVSGLVLTAPVAHAAPPPASGWVLGYGFESLQGGVVHDASPSGITGVLRGTTLPVTAVSRTGHGRALSLDSAKQQFVDVPDSAVLDVDRYTLAAWVRYLPNVHDDRWEVIEKAGAYWMNIRTDTRKLRVGGFYGSCDGQLGDTWRYVDSVKTIPAKTWVHVASTYDGATLEDLHQRGAGPLARRERPHLRQHRARRRSGPRTRPRPASSRRTSTGGSTTSASTTAR